MQSSAPGDSVRKSLAPERPRKNILPLLALCGVIYVLWAAWAVWLRDWVAAGKSPRFDLIAGIVARLLFWGAPAGVYLHRVWGRQFAHPLGLNFPLGAAQLRRTILLSALVTWALFTATAARNGVSLSMELQAFFSSARPRLTAPIFEELLFRGIILSELLDWTHRNSKSPAGLRSRYFVAQLSCAAFFVLIHWPSWWSHLGLAAVLERSLPIFAVGLVLGFVFAHTRSIWPCIWLHWLNNELSLMS